MNQSLDHVQKYDLGRHFIRDPLIFRDFNVTHMNLYYENIRILLEHVNTLRVKHKELDLVSIEISHINIIVACMPLVLNLSWLSNVLTIVAAIL